MDTVIPEGGGKRRQAPIGTLAANTSTLLDAFIKLKVGEVLSYEEMTALIDRDVRPKYEGYQHLQSARKIALQHYQVVLGSLRKVGVKRLADAEKVKEVQSRAVRIRRASKTAIQVGTAMDNFDALPSDLKEACNTAISAMRVVELVASRHGMKTLVAKVRELGSQLPVVVALKELAH